MELTGKIQSNARYYTEKPREVPRSVPYYKSVYEDKNNQFERIVVPFTDGIKSLNVVTDLKKHTKLKELNLLISKKYHFIYCR
jgi:preprotein translocase subunit SecA